MNESPTLIIGEYETISKVKIRREPRIVEYWEGKVFHSNQVGLLDIGTRRMVYGLLTDNMNVTWGRVSESDAAGIAQWVCIRGLNRTYMKPVTGGSNVLTTEGRLAKLEQWARTKGYEG